jgi:hypothetical protein
VVVANGRIDVELLHNGRIDFEVAGGHLLQTHSKVVTVVGYDASLDGTGSDPKLISLKVVRTDRDAQRAPWQIEHAAARSEVTEAQLGRVVRME